MSPQFVIVGANLAGGTAAVTLREEGFEGEIILIGAEPQPPYERPFLSKEYLRGEKPLIDGLLKPSDYYSQNNIQTRFGVRATQLDLEKKSVKLENGELIPYDKLLVATGVRNRQLKIPGANLAGIYDLRTAADADLIRTESLPGRKAVLIGMGFIGSEVAASLRHMGLEVAVIEPFKTPLFRVLGEEVGQVFADIHHEQGVQLYFGEAVVSFEGEGRVERVLTGSGLKLDCDFVVVGVGVEPATELLAGTGVKVENGIVVDAFCQTNVADIYAAGDVANHYHPLFERHLRVEHWQNAIKQGRAAALSMLGRGEPYQEVHWFWSDQYEHNIQYTGFHSGWDRLLIRGSLAKRDFIAFYLQNGYISAAVALNRSKELIRTTPLIRAKVVIDPTRLVDETVDLRTLLPGTRVRPERSRVVASPEENGSTYIGNGG